MSGADWQRNADTHKMQAEDLSKHGLEGSKKPPVPGDKRPGGVLHQRSRLPQNPLFMAVGGFALVAGMAYFMLASKPEKGISPNQVVASTVGDSSGQPRN